ncbi:MAG: pilus assembly protein TadG-related protein [Vulcanimicrobiaceae bacterium]
MRRNGERGQLLPVWTLGVITLLAMSLFIVNYANIMRWQVRGQNAADAAAAASMSPIADGWNEIELQLYASTIEEMRIRYLNQAILNTLAQQGCTSTAACTADYNALNTQLQSAVNNYDTNTLFVQNLGSMVNDRYLDPSNGAFETITGGPPAISGWPDDTTCDKVQGGNGYNIYSGGWAGPPSAQPTPGGSWVGWSSTGCTSQSDVAFKYTPVDVDSGDIGYGTPNLAEVVACKNVSLIGAKLLGLGNTATFKDVAVSAYTVSPIPEAFNPGVTINPSTGNAYQPTETYTSDPSQGSLYTVDYGGLTVNVNFYLPVPTPAYKTFNPFGTDTTYPFSAPQVCG